MSLDANLRKLSTDTLIQAVGSTISPLIITDNQQPDNPIVYANKAFLDLCGYDESEIIGENCRFLQGKDSDKKTIKRIRSAVKDNEDIRVNLKNYRKDGTMFWNDLVISPIKDKNGKTTHFIGMQLDITERIMYTEKLEAIEKSLLVSNQELEQFTYAASHDLQEPLRMVSSYLQLIKKRYSGSFDDDGKTFMDFALEGAERMQQLINDLLTLSRVSTMAKKFKPVPMNDIIERALFNLKITIDETHANIHVPQLPTITVDAPQIVQLMQNLIGNAIKYRRPGVAPDVTIAITEKDDMYVCSVTDNGIGIEPKYHDRIFTIFQRLHTRDEYPGTGIGLSICSKIIDRHGGKLWVESDGKHGSTFTFTLPIKRKARS